MNRHVLPLALCLVLVSLLAPAPVRGAGGWSVSASTDLVRADFISQSGSQADVYLEDHVSFEPFGIPEAGAVLDALGFGGGYSQEVSWGSGGGPAVSCPKGLTDLFSFCSTNTSGGWALIPDGLRTELALSAPASGSRTLDVRPSLRSLAYDGTVAAIGIALETLSPGPIGSNATQVSALAIQLLPEAAGFEAAMERKDYTTAGFELLSLAKRAMTIIADHVTQWAIGSIVDLIPGLAEVKLGIAVSKAIVVLASLDGHLLAGNAATNVTVEYGGGGGASGTTPTSLLTPTPTPTPAPNAGTFSSTGSMSTARVGHTATLLADGRVLIAGGSSATGPLASAELYDPRTGTFSSTGSMTTARSAQVATLLADGRVLIVGGCGDEACSKFLASAELYDPATGRFTSTGSMKAYNPSTATLLPSGRVLVSGACPDAQCQQAAAVAAELYDPSTGQFSTLSSLVAQGTTNDVLLSNGLVLVVSYLGGPQLYDPSTGRVSPIGSRTTNSLAPLAVRLSDGRVLLAGGLVSTDRVAAAELYDPATGFSVTGSMQTPRSDGTGTLLPNGQVLIAGGCADRLCTPISTAESYDPASTAFSSTGSMTTPREEQTATLLSDGRVLITGGDGPSGPPVASAELYQP